MFEDSTLEDALDKMISLAQGAKGAAIDAACCGTRYDYDKMRAAEEELLDARDAFLQRFGETP